MGWQTSPAPSAPVPANTATPLRAATAAERTGRTILRVGQRSGRVCALVRPVVGVASLAFLST
eukprot:SAG31_NODE_40871_length_278_cov_1.726257_1_plen_62_part_01